MYLYDVTSMYCLKLKNRRFFKVCLIQNLYVLCTADRDKVFTKRFVKETTMSGEFVNDSESEIVGYSANAPEWSQVVPGPDHDVLYDMQNHNLPYHKNPSTIWDQYHVKMPFDSHNVYNVGGYSENRWNIIRESLKRPIANSRDLANAIKRYNKRYDRQWRFTALHALFKHLDAHEAKFFFDNTLPKIICRALELPDLIRAPIPLLRRHQNRQVSLSQLQISSLLANAFLCTFPHRNSTSNNEYNTYPNINFSKMFEAQGYSDLLAKLKCIIHYFTRVCNQTPTGVVTFSRRYVPLNYCPNWSDSHKIVGHMKFRVNSAQSIEEAAGHIQVDFANKYIGGGVIGHGSVQEEIRFVICPELMASMLFTEVMDDTEAVMIIGAEQYSSYTGYGRGFRWKGDHHDVSQFDNYGRRRVAVLAIDAIPVTTLTQEQEASMMRRELNKAWVGFSFFKQSDGPTYPGVATGKWGSGAFGGSRFIKWLVQVLACRQADRNMAYYTFRDEPFEEELKDCFLRIRQSNIPVGALYTLLLDLSKRGIPPQHQKEVFIRDYLSRYDGNRRNGGNTRRRRPRSASFNSEDSQSSDECIGQQELNKSPDLFSQDDEQCEKVSVLQSEAPLETKDIKELNQDDNKTAPKTEETTGGDGQKTAAKRASNHTSRLFNEMKKFDEDNGKLNLLSQSSSPLSPTKDTRDPPMDVDDKLLESPEAKKKIGGKKITDYFNKK